MKQFQEKMWLNIHLPKRDTKR